MSSWCSQVDEANVALQKQSKHNETKQNNQPKQKEK